ncbi:hypothetical protein AYO45_05185 [Gammaproteobacteria bacterium SCGC AG-212-F23]|nr:hypothetical protein AYO45_05185 [Gammaproteobacteria bacterium SCGC AG-212-F23]
MSYKKKNFQEITFDDLQLRQLANQDPALFLQQFPPPLLLDEVQYVPNLFSELKIVIDKLKRAALVGSQKYETLFLLTGSNQILMDKNIKESLAGRAAYYYLNTLSIHEILNALPKTSIKDILFKGGWPELYTNNTLSPVTYINDYIRSYVEKDIVMSAGIQKLAEFHTVIKLLSARTAQETRYTEISNNSGISSVTVKEWVGLLERADLIYLLKPYHNNLNSRLIKSPKLYFLDTGLAVRLQGWSDVTPLISSPQIGALFETLALAEIVKFMRNYNKDWELFFWRTKDGEEIDFIIKTNAHTIHAFETKLSIQNIPKTITFPTAFKEEFSTKNPLIIITYGGKKLMLSSQCMTLPIDHLHDYLLTL